MMFVLYRDGEDNNNEKLYCANLELPVLFELSYYANAVIPVFLLESVIGKLLLVLFKFSYYVNTYETHVLLEDDEVRFCVV